MKQNTDSKGHVYFKSYHDARDFGVLHCKGYPAWRCVAYDRGWAVQVRPSGPYLNKEGKIVE